MFEQTFKNIDDILWKDSGCSTELDINRLSSLVELKYKSLHDGQKVLGDTDKIKSTFIDFQSIFTNSNFYQWRKR